MSEIQEFERARKACGEGSPKKWVCCPKGCPATPGDRAVAHLAVASRSVKAKMKENLRDELYQTWLNWLERIDAIKEEMLCDAPKCPRFLEKVEELSQLKKKGSSV